MGLGCAVFVLFIFIPYIVCWLFAPLYLTLLIAGAFRGFKVENPASTFLLPLAPFAAACVLCIAFWWAIPFLVNTADMILDAFKSIFVSSNSISFIREDIPNGKCFLYFIAIFGGSIGSMFSIASIGKLWEESQSGQQHIKQKRKAERNTIREARNVKRQYNSHAISKEEANRQIAKDLEKWGKGLGLSQATIQRYYNEYSIKGAEFSTNPIVSPDMAKNEKIKSLCKRASIDFTPKVKKLRQQYNSGKLTKEEVMKSLYADFKIWAAEFDLSENEAKTVWKSVYKKINLQNKGQSH